MSLMTTRGQGRGNGRGFARKSLMAVPAVAFLMLLAVDLSIYARVDREILDHLTRLRRRIEAIGDIRRDATLAYQDVLEWRLAPAEEGRDRAEAIDEQLGVLLGEVELFAATSSRGRAEADAVARLRRDASRWADDVLQTVGGHLPAHTDLHQGLVRVDDAATEILDINASAGAAADIRVAELFRRRMVLHGFFLGGVGLVLVLAMVFWNWSTRTRAQLADSERRRGDLSRMAASLAHEINNQLAVLENTGALLRRRHPGEELIRFGEEAIEQIRGLVANLRAFSDVGDGPRHEVDVADLVEQLALPFGDQVRVTAQRPSSLRADGQALSRVVLNLLKNGLEAGGPVEIAVVAVDDGVRVTIGDSGPGVPPEHAKKVGEPFFTTKARGTGLGLAIVREYAARNGGRFSLRNRPQGGAVAELWLPSHSGDESLRGTRKLGAGSEGGAGREAARRRAAGGY